MSERRTIDIAVEPNDLCPEGCDARFSSSGDELGIHRVRIWRSNTESVICAVTGWSSGGECPCHAAAIEDSGEGTALLVYGGDHGLRLTPEDGTAAFGEPYLRISESDRVG